MRPASCPAAPPGSASRRWPGGLDTPAIAAALAAGELTAVYLLAVDPLRELPDRGAWEQALERASTVIAHAAFLTEGVREHATVVFPAEAAAEKEGTVTHPDGRVQRMRPAIARQGSVRAEWSVLAELCERCGDGGGLPRTGVEASAAVFDAVPFYGGLDLATLAGHGARWQERAQAAAMPAPRARSRRRRRPGVGHGRRDRRRLRLGRYRSIWASPEVEASPALQFLVRGQRVEVSATDARALGLRDGDRMLVVDEDGAAIEAQVAVRDAVPAGRAFLERGIARHGAKS